METEVLRWFQHVADGVTVTEVADIHLVSQPAVSRGLARLEDEVGTPLLARAGRVLRLTEAGAAFKAHLDQALFHLDDGIAAVGELLDPERGTVSVAFETSLGLWLVPGLIAGFRRQHPGVRFNLEQTHDLRTWEDAVEWRLDAAFTSQRPTDPDLTWEHLVSLPLALAVPPGHPCAKSESVSLATAQDERFIMVGGDWQLRRVTQMLCQAAGFNPSISFEGEDITVVRAFVANGLGVAVVPVTQAEARYRRTPEVLVPLSDLGAGLDVGPVWSHMRRALPSAQLFRDYVLAARA